MYGIIVRDDNISLNVEATSKKIASLIDKSGYTDKELSQKLNISIQAINKWRHQHSIPDIQNIFSLAKILDVSIDEMMVPKGFGDIQITKEQPMDIDAFFERMMAYKDRIVIDQNTGEIRLKSDTEG